MNKSGFITLHRQILDWEWYGDVNTFRVFLHILLTANYADGKFEGKTIKRGQLVTSLTSLAAGTSLSVRQVRVSLDHLQMTGEVTSSSYPRYRIITVVKYDEYQLGDRLDDSLMTGSVTSKWQADDKLMTGSVTSKRQQYNNIINNNKEKKKEEIKENSPSESKRNAPRFTPPSKEEILDYCFEEGYGIDVDKFFDYYASKGWKVGSSPMKDWRAAVRNWARRDNAVIQNPNQGVLFKPQAPKKTVPAQQYSQRDYSGEDDLARMVSMMQAGEGEV